MSDHSFENTYEVISDSIPFIYSFFTNSLESSESFRTTLVNLLDYIFEVKKKEYCRKKREYDRKINKENSNIKDQKEVLLCFWSCYCFILNILMMVILLFSSPLRNRLNRSSFIAE